MEQKKEKLTDHITRYTVNAFIALNQEMHESSEYVI